MEIVEIGCPRSINLISIPEFKNKYGETKSIMQTIDIYDFVSIKKDINKSLGVLIISRDNLTNELKNNIRKIINIFSNYIGVFINDITIEIKYDDYIYSKREENILAGLLIALNDYFKVQLTMSELIYLGEKINSFISYYLVGGYKKVLENGKFYNIGNNQYKKYLILNNFSTDNIEEYDRLRNYLLNYNNTFLGKNEYIFIAIKDILKPNFVFSLKKEFSYTSMHILNNVDNHRVLIKYLK